MVAIIYLPFLIIKKVESPPALLDTKGECGEPTGSQTNQAIGFCVQHFHLTAIKFSLRI
jgi:hypothetical protein